MNKTSISNKRVLFHIHIHITPDSNDKLNCSQILQVMFSDKIDNGINIFIVKENHTQRRCIIVHMHKIPCARRKSISPSFSRCARVGGVVTSHISKYG